MAKKFVYGNSCISVIIYGKDRSVTTNSSYASVRMNVKGVITKQFSAGENCWYRNEASEAIMFYGSQCFCPKRKSARTSLRSMVKGKRFASAYYRYYCAVNPYHSVERREREIAEMLLKLEIMTR